jgi:hypothetical protein
LVEVGETEPRWKKFTDKTARIGRLDSLCVKIALRGIIISAVRIGRKKSVSRQPM